MRTALIDRLRTLAISVNADDGGLDLTTCPRKWREDAMHWQADLSVAQLLAAFEAAYEDRWDAESLWESVKLELAELHADDWHREQSRRTEEAIAERVRHTERVREVADAVGEALGITLDGYAGSLYGSFHGLEVRVSDHRQVAGGGYSEARGERHGEAVISFVVRSASSPLPSRADVRQRMAEAAIAYREHGYSQEFVEIVL